MQNPLRQTLLALAVLLATTGCQDPYATVLRFEATPLTLPPGGGEVELSWETKNATGIALQPGHHHSLPESGTLRLVITESTEFTLGLSGQVRDFTGSENVRTLRVEVETLEVSGKVLDAKGVPAPNVGVSIIGSDPVVTDESGRFTIPGVTPPYALRVHDPTHGSWPVDQFWLDLTDPHPTVFAAEANSVVRQNQPFDVNVAWTGGGVSNVPAGADPFTTVYAFSKEVSTDGYIWSSAAPSGEARVGLAHPVPLSGPIRIFVLQGFVEEVLEANTIRSIFHFQRLGETEIPEPITEWPVNAGTVALSPVTTTTIDVEVIAGSWLADTLGAFEIVLPGFARLRLFGAGSVARSYQLTAPSIPGAILSYNGRATADEHAGEPGPQTHLGGVTWAGTGPLRLEPDAPPFPVTPTRDAPFEDRFAFTRELPGPCRVTLSTHSGTVQIHSDRREFTGDFLTSVGVDYRERGYWLAECPSGFASLDEARSDLARYLSALNSEPGQMLGEFGVISY